MRDYQVNSKQFIERWQIDKQGNTICPDCQQSMPFGDDVFNRDNHTIDCPLINDRLQRRRGYDNNINTNTRGSTKTIDHAL